MDVERMSHTLINRWVDTNHPLKLQDPNVVEIYGVSVLPPRCRHIPLPRCACPLSSFAYQALAMVICNDKCPYVAFHGCI